MKGTRSKVAFHETLACHSQGRRKSAGHKNLPSAADSPSGTTSKDFANTQRWPKTAPAARADASVAATNPTHRPMIKLLCSSPKPMATMRPPAAAQGKV